MYKNYKKPPTQLFLVVCTFFIDVNILFKLFKKKVKEINQCDTDHFLNSQSLIASCTSALEENNLKFLAAVATSIHF